MIPFLGAGANLCDRGDEAWEHGGPFLPSGAELAEHLAARGRYPVPGRAQPAPRVAVRRRGARRGRALPLPPRGVRRRVRADVAAPAARARRRRRCARRGLPQLLVVTTNYDDLVERALADEGLEFDVVWYEAKQNAEARGRFLHRAPGGKPKRDHAAEQVRGPAGHARAAGGAQAARLPRPRRAPATTATSSPRTATSTTSRAATSAR